MRPLQGQVLSGNPQPTLTARRRGRDHCVSSAGSDSGSSAWGATVVRGLVPHLLPARECLCQGRSLGIWGRWTLLSVVWPPAQARLSDRASREGRLLT